MIKYYIDKADDATLLSTNDIGIIILKLVKRFIDEKMDAALRSSYVTGDIVSGHPRLYHFMVYNYQYYRTEHISVEISLDYKTIKITHDDDSVEYPMPSTEVAPDIMCEYVFPNEVKVAKEYAEMYMNKKYYEPLYSTIKSIDKDPKGIIRFSIESGKNDSEYHNLEVTLGPYNVFVEDKNCDYTYKYDCPEIKNTKPKKASNVIMDYEKFVTNCKAIIRKYYEEHFNKVVSANDIHVVWITKVLQNNKALLSTTVEDGMYYEITYNGDKNEIYFDAYHNDHNQKFNVDNSNNVDFENNTFTRNIL